MSLALSSLRARALTESDAVVLTTGTESLTGPQLLAAVEKMARQLADSSVRVLAIAADNSADWIIADLAAQCAGVPAVPLPLFFSADQIAHVLADSGADAIAADEPGSAGLSGLPTRFIMELRPELTLLGLDAVQSADKLPPATARISYTSGTTGTPKGVCLTQTAMDTVARSLCEVTESLQLERHLCLLPLPTLLENIAGVLAPMLAGATIAVPPLVRTGLLGASGLDVTRLVECLREFEPHSVILLPQMLEGLVSAVENGTSLPESLRFVAVGGGVVGHSLLQRAEACGIPAFEGYGLTETCSVAALNSPAANKIGSVGRPLPHCSIRIGPDSEVFVVGSGMTAYLSDESPAESEIATGDIGEIDQDGFLFIRGRKKNVIVSSFGRNLSPEWVEASLASAPSITQAALFGDGRPFNVAVVVPAAGATIDDIGRDVASTNNALPDYARVRRWIFASGNFSAADGTLTRNGRIVRSTVQSLYQQQIDDCFDDLLASYA